MPHLRKMLILLIATCVLGCSGESPDPPKSIKANSPKKDKASLDVNKKDDSTRSKKKDDESKSEDEDEGNAKKWPTVPVLGRLTIGKAAATEVQIRLVPVDSKSGLHEASGNTGPDGKFQFTTGQIGTPGVLPGRYKLVLRRLADVSDDLEIPKKYENDTTSDIEIEITGENRDLLIEIE